MAPLSAKFFGVLLLLTIMLRLFFVWQPLAPANGAPADATRDPLLRDKVHGAHILEVRKALAFAGFTHKSPRAIDYSRVPIGEIYRGHHWDDAREVDMEMAARGRNTVRLQEAGTMRRGRAMSM